ncbi:GIY-YIG nuclease family protein [Brevifollis gellanilyticus]|uniref:GIY-YIG domain-containing protein n=1 Tax=Brevifollis gellanilyticus TaxID=748831 RepID=A0A512M9F0_9BACT|nr:GIY-YIG nuclease family protein [Brevifollis gellanilyticus]GEP43349.1 hypothetical protein BGE01nite_26400 [Brevifollis gellanilyticus]
MRDHRFKSCPRYQMKAVQQCTAFAISRFMYFVYVIQNDGGRFYIGLSDDVERRLVDHNSGVSTWTRHRGPWKLVWTSAPMSLTDARKVENLLKAQKGGDGFYRLTGLIRQNRSSGS